MNRRAMLKLVLAVVPAVPLLRLAGAKPTGLKPVRVGSATYHQLPDHIHSPQEPWTWYTRWIESTGTRTAPGVWQAEAAPVLAPGRADG